MVKDKEFYKTIFRISLPAAFQALISFFVIIVDDIMVSSLSNGVWAQAAVAQVNSITAFYTATIGGLVSGSAVLISQYWGRKDTKRIKSIFSVVIAFCFFTSLAFVLAAIIFPNKIIGIVIGANETQVKALALKYFRIVCFSYLPYCITTAFVGMLRSVEIVKISLYITISSLFVNIGLNYILIFGKLGMPALGVEGAAIATLSARIIEMLIICIYVFKVQQKIPYCFKDLLKFEKWLAKDYVRYGVPVGLTDMQWALIGMLKAAIIGNLGAAFMAANSIATSMLNLGMLFTFALAGGACVVVGKAVGAGSYKQAREYSNTIQIMFAFFGIITAAIMLLLKNPFISLYGSSSDENVRQLASSCITIVAITCIGSSYHAGCFVGINRGAGDSRFVAKVDMICGWFIVLPITLLAAFVWHLPLPMVFLCSRIDQCFKWIIAFLRLRGNKWIKNVTKQE